MIRGGGDVEAMIREEKRLTAIESQNTAWAEGEAWGIESDILAEAALTTAFEALVREGGEDAALAMIERLRDKVVSGAFEPKRTRH
ncbi:MAG: hypothetical protein JJ913_14980 [Rhizobiaceae bacterium]|nr:hypothetical protein [Rhizobiaceae bacterium]